MREQMMIENTLKDRLE